MTHPKLDLLAENLQELHRAAGAPTYREIAFRAGDSMSHTTVMDALRGIRVTNWAITQDIAHALGGDEAVAIIQHYWIEAHAEKTGVRKSRQVSSAAGPALYAERLHRILHTMLAEVHKLAPCDDPQE